MPSSYVQIAGQQFATELLTSVVVQQRLNAHWTCTVVFRSTPDQRPDLESMQGNPLKIVTYDILGTEHVLFSGLVHRVAVRYEVWGSYGGTLEAVSLCWQMASARNYSYNLKQTPQDIAQQLTGNSGLDLTGTISGDANASRVQWAETDYDFLLQLADDAESWVRPTETGLEVQSSFQPGVPLVWREGEYGLLEFSAAGRVQPQTLGGTHYDPATMTSQQFEGVQSKTPFYDDASSGLVSAALAAGQALPAADHGNRQRSITLDNYDQRLQLESRRAGANAVVCRGVSREMQVTAGNEITIVGLPSGSGTYGVIACEHVWTGKGYENHFTATPVKRWFAQARPPRATAGGLFPARIAANYDPHNQGRVQISFPWMSGAPTTWARLLMPHAGADRGFLFFPELGDEVAVRFEGADPERPVVLGSVWNGVQQPPTEGFWQPGTVNETEFASNYIKRIVTKSGIRVTLNDTPGQESIHLATPNSNQVFMTEKANETGRPMVALHTTGDIVVHAKGRVHSKSKTTSRHAGDKQPVPAPKPALPPKKAPQANPKCAAARGADKKLVDDTSKAIQKQLGRTEPQDGVRPEDAGGAQLRPGDWTSCQNRAADMGTVMRRFKRSDAALPSARAALNVNKLGDKPGSKAKSMDCVTRLPDNAAELNPALGLPPGTITDDMLRNDKTGFRAALYRDDATGKAILVSRDTEPQSLVDWKTNTDNGAGLDTDQYREQRTLTNALAIKGVDFDQAGYSKGGGLAQQAGLLNPNGKTYVFNSAGIPQDLIARTGGLSAAQLTSNTSAFSSQGDFLTYLNTTTDPTQQIKNAQWLETNLAKESSWSSPLQTAIALKYLDPATSKVSDPGFPQQKADYLSGLQNMINQNAAASAAGKPIQVFPPVYAATHDTIPGSIGDVGNYYGANSPMSDNTFDSQMSGKLYQHQMSVVADSMESSVKKDREAMQSFVKQCG